MPVLEDPRHEAFALGVATGLIPARAYANAGFNTEGARQNAHRLAADADVSLRIQEIRIQISKQVIAGVVAREIADRNARLAELQTRWDQLRDQLDCILEERGAELAEETAGGSTGLIRKDYKGKDADIPVYRIDPAVIDLYRLLLEHEKRAAEECGQWGEKPSVQDQSRARYVEADQ